MTTVSGPTSPIAGQSAVQLPATPAKIDPVVKAIEILTAAGFGRAPNTILVNSEEIGPLGQTKTVLALRSVGKIDNAERRNLETAIATIEEETGLKCSPNIRWV